MKSRTIIWTAVLLANWLLVSCTVSQEKDERRAQIRELMQKIWDKEVGVRKYAIFSLGELNAKEAIPAIEESLKYKEVRAVAIYALGELGAKDAIPEIKKFLKDTDAHTRGMSGIALVKLGDKDSVPKETIEDIKPILKLGAAWHDKSMIKLAKSALRQLGVSNNEIERVMNEK